MNYLMLFAGVIYWGAAAQYFYSGNWKLGCVSILYGIVNFFLATIK